MNTTLRFIILTFLVLSISTSCEKDVYTVRLVNDSAEELDIYQMEFGTLVIKQYLDEVDANSTQILLYEFKTNVGYTLMARKKSNREIVSNPTFTQTTTNVYEWYIGP